MCVVCECGTPTGSNGFRRPLKADWQKNNLTLRWLLHICALIIVTPNGCCFNCNCCRLSVVGCRLGLIDRNRVGIEQGLEIVLLFMLQWAASIRIAIIFCILMKTPATSGAVNRGQGQGKGCHSGSGLGLEWGWVRGLVSCQLCGAAKWKQLPKHA